MSDLPFDPFVDEQARPLVPAGQLWHERGIEEQLPLFRQMASMLNRVTGAAHMAEMGSWIQGAQGTAMFHVWAVLPSQVQVQGPRNWGYDPLTLEPAREDGRLYPADRDRAYLTADGNVIEVKAGSDLPEDIVLNEQTVWFVPRPPDFHPVELLSEKITLMEGTGFLCVGDWLLLYRNPLTLWSDLVLPTMSIRMARSWKSTTLSANNLYSSGRQVALYRRNIQTLKQFERALCEIAGLPVLETEGTLVRMEAAGNQVLHWLDDGRSFTLPVQSPYSLGQVIPADDGHILHLRHQGLQGDSWWSSRSWGGEGIPIHMIRPGYYGFSITDSQVPALVFYDGSSYHGKLVFNQDSEKEDIFWNALAAWERRSNSSTFVIDVLQINETTLVPMLDGEGNPIEQVTDEYLYQSSESEHATRNGLEVFMRAAGSWFGVVETSLDVVNPVAFQEILDFVEREKPAGSQIYVAGESDAFKVPEYYAVFLNTGELVDIETGVALVLPLGYG